MGDGVRLIDLHQVTYGGKNHEHPVFSPDGKRLAYYAGTYGWLQIYVTASDGSGERPLSCVKGNHTQPAFSPDGVHVYYRAQDDGNAPWRIERVEVDDPGKRVVLLSKPGVSFKHPSPSPDGASLAWFSDEGTPGNFHLFRGSLSGDRITAITRLTDDPNRNDCHPTWSPDGSKLAFHAYLGREDAGESHIFVGDADGKNIRRLTSEAGFHKHPFFVGKDLVVHHTEDSERRYLVLRRVADGALIGTLTSGKKNDKHPSPFVPLRGRTLVAFASKKRGVDREGATEPTYDLFVGTLDGVRVRR